MKRQSQPLNVGISANSSHSEVLSFLAGLLTVRQYSDVTDVWVESQHEPDGHQLLSCEINDLRALGFTGQVATKLDRRLKEVRLALAAISPDTSSEEDPESGNTTSTPLVESADPAPQEIDLATTDPASLPLQKRGRGRPLKAGGRQSRLSQRLDAAAAVTMSSDDSDAALVGSGRRRTRLGVSRLAAVEKAGARIHEEDPEDVPSNPDEYSPSDEDEENAGAMGASESDEEMAAVPTRRRARGRRQAAVADTQIDDMEVDVDERTEEPDDGVKPDNSEWDRSVREGLEAILKQLPAEHLKHIVIEESWPDKIYKYIRKNANGMSETKERPRATMAPKIVKMMLDNTLEKAPAEEGGTTWEGIDEYLTKYVPEESIVAYLENTLKKHFAVTPHITDTRRLLWRLWCRPLPRDGPKEASIGQITFPLHYVGRATKLHWDTTCYNWGEEDKEGEPFLEMKYFVEQMATANASEAAVNAAAAANVAVKPEPDGSSMPTNRPTGAELILAAAEGDDDWEDLFQAMVDLGRLKGVEMRCRLDNPAKNLRVEMVCKFGANKAELFVNGCYTMRSGDGVQLRQVWLDKVLQAMDHLRGTPVLDHDLEALNEQWDKSCDEMEARQVELALDPPHQVNIRMFDRIMASVENADRPMEAGVRDECEDRLALTLKPYQLRALSFMLREERAVGGTARHLWVKVPLPGAQPGVECYVSPSLFQMYVSKSPTATGIALGTGGGGGWQALEMGMGKTAVIIAGIAFNPPPADWRRARTWKPYDASDHMLTITENMPRGGTLVVVPQTLIRQWEMEINKTLDVPEELTVLRWVEGSRTTNCADIAAYDVVLTTPQLVTKSSTLSSICWHRVVVDEAQLNAGSLMKSGSLISTHRWIVTGTPCNALPETIAPSLEFLRLGGFEAAQRYLPPALATVLRCAMLRYTKDGLIDGAKNLELPPLTERVVACHLNEQDGVDERSEAQEAYITLTKKVTSALKDMSALITQSLEDVLADRTALAQLATESKKISMPMLKRLVPKMRSIVGGGAPVKTEEMVYDPRKGRDVFQTRHFTSKAEAVVADLQRLKDDDSDAKVLVFSEYNELLKTIASLLPDIGLDHRSLLGSTSAKKRGEAIEAFMSDPPTRVFLLGAKVGGVGITLTAATHVYICEPLMNPALELQAVGRSRRMGQTKPVTVTRLYTRESIEERVRTMLTRRHSATPQATATAANVAASEFKCSLADMVELLKTELPVEEDEEEGEGVGGN